MLAAIGAGLLVMAGFPPYEWTIASWVGLVGFVWLLTTAPSLRQARWTAYVFALSFFGVLLWWLSEVELIAFYPMILLQALPILFVAGGVYRYRNASPVVYVVAVAGSMGLAEYLRVRWPYGGFPWGSIGLTVGATPLRPSAQWWGASGWTVILAAGAAVIVLSLRRRIRIRTLGLIIAGISLVGVAGNMWPAVPDGDTRSVSIIQGNSPCPGTRCADERILIFESHLALTRELVPGTVDLVVWPESSTGSVTEPVENPEYGAIIGGEASRLGAMMLVGGDRDAGPENFINANVAFDAEGAIVGEYLKRHPVPFGEYVPLRSILDWIPALDRVPRDLIRGSEPVLFDLQGVPFASVISYEGAFARYERDSVRAGARFIVVATNEASFGDTPSSDQFLAISRLRAAELGVDIVHAAVTGRSAFVHADGRVNELTDLYQTSEIRGQMTARGNGDTLYAMWGDWLQVLVMLGYVGLRVRDRLESVGRQD